ncbi:MAG: hypothetical protein LBD74_01360 [Spirochaetaceae bacterium]|jgi:hypothetical protein|nr:hypothetical protein [Spirochaetaceae bacterium]
MQQDHLKAALLAIEEPPLNFTVIFSGKQSKRVNGLYKPESREIIIHNRNFTDDNLLLYTAIHEYAHHLHACAQGGRLGSRAHTAAFWAIFHHLLGLAETKGVYKNVFATSPELNRLTEIIKERYLKENGVLMRELGMHLLKAEALCQAIGGRFEDYIDRVLCIPRTAATTAVKLHQYQLNPAVGPDNMRFLAGIRDPKARGAAETALLEGNSPDTVRIQARNGLAGLLMPPEEPQLRLEKEKKRLERTIASLSKRLEELTQELTRYEA